MAFSILVLASTMFATIWVGFGINAILRPDHALTFFEFSPPAGASDKQLVNSLMFVYGVRDIFMGLACYAAAFTGNKRTLGWILLAGSGVAFADGFVCYQAGKGEWNHWGYAPMLTIVGALLIGASDRRA
ncbi:hypothetical protein V5O48_012632 [Marasmius crinis-equi]|uniref:Integral membrane protein n=1 Tax=Marasmius crinis-equi TaxID=585013 RepID=A0ABR3F286_9AGAR